MIDSLQFAGLVFEVTFVALGVFAVRNALVRIAEALEKANEKDR